MPPLLGVYVFTDRLAFAAADWCFRLHGWPIMPPLLGVYVFTDRLAFAATDWCFRLHGWPLCRRCWASTSSPTGLPSPPPTGVSACTAGLLCRRCWASTSSPTGLPSPPPTGVSACTVGLYAAVVGRLRLHRPACLRRHRLVFPPARLAFMPPLLGVYVFTDRPPRPPPTGASACTADVLCRRCWASTSSPTGRLVRRRLVLPPARLTYYAAVVGRLRLHRPAASTAADWCFRLHGWPIMPPLLGVYVFTDRLAFAAADWCFRLHGWPLCRRCWASTSSPTGRLVRRRLVLPPARLTYYAAVVGRLRLHRPAASTAADWCFRLHSLPIMPPLLGVYVFTDRPPRPPPTGASACTADLLCRRCWASTSSPTGRLDRRRLVFPPARLAYYAAVVGRLRLHRPACLRRRRLVFPPARLAFMPPLLGVYVFTDRPPRPPPTGASACTADLLCRRCWASTSSPTGRLDRRRLVFPPARWPIMPPLMGVCVFTDRLAFAAADWCLRLHGWPIMLSLLGVYDSTTVLPPSPPTGVSVCTAGLLCRRCWASTSSSTGRLVRRRLVSPPTRLAYYAAVVGHLYLHRRSSRLLLTSALTSTSGYTATTTDGHHRLPSPTGYAAADWCFYLHNCASSPPDFYLDIFNTYLQSSNDYSTTRSYSSRLYVQLFPN
uniref:cysteine dioxygenase n=1 Tax=Oryza sativa subsp. japonica TaxID=39947 RepID=Q69MP6_ORYSJ|nr:HGWP repeat containing protein-like [Oryza sativa Japonica Group]BAD33869.1 HGWP repeat containing protein-like [Oryza sativa Japonica Group]